ncbi:hypothetical protein AWB81_04734 [Caballeronia arationis]|uniref:hypothetical protein n=1 Tax=Caballeronia arationis TaxID=1777142 RepID=UPI00074B9F49|nr:hypothetical protein [Caballeronia arationis]SAK89340.1 hypothetical protein AWB81_04734 [Caballeronia arationis]
MQQQSGKVVGPSSQKLKLANARERGTVLGPIGDITQRTAPESGPDPLKEEMRFCDWAFSGLGHVTVFRFSEGGFMLLAENGQRARGDTLVVALLAMLERQGLNNPRLIYPETGSASRAA